VFDELEGLHSRADLFGDPVQLVVEDIAQPLREYERQDVVFVFRRILRAPNRASGVPNNDSSDYLSLSWLQNLIQNQARVAAAEYPFRRGKSLPRDALGFATEGARYPPG
jgi:hypothetical protein